MAANLRPTVTALGPVLTQLGQSRGLDTVELGLLGAIPLVAFAIISPFVHLLTKKLGAERAVFYALLMLTLGTILRSLPGTNINLWLGTAILSASIAVGNVLVPAIVKRDFPNRVGIMTSIYSASLSGVAAIGSGIAFPISEIWGWEASLGVWAALSLLAAGVWSFRLGPKPVRPDTPAPSAGAKIWSSALAWQIASFMGLQSLGYYFMITWLPTIETAQGIGEAETGLHLFFYQILGILGGLIAGPLLQVGKDQRMAAAMTTLPMIVAMIGFATNPELVWLWLTLAGLSSGATLVVALTLIALRARSTSEAASLSGMAQGFGYLIAAFGPWGAGLVFELSGDWNLVMLLVAGTASLQLIFGLCIGRNIHISFRGETGADYSPK